MTITGLFIRPSALSQSAHSAVCQWPFPRFRSSSQSTNTNSRVGPTMKEVPSKVPNKSRVCNTAACMVQLWYTSTHKKSSLKLTLHQSLYFFPRLMHITNLVVGIYSKNLLLRNQQSCLRERGHSDFPWHTLPPSMRHYSRWAFNNMSWRYT